MESIALIVFLCFIYFHSYLFYDIARATAKMFSTYRQRERHEMLLKETIMRRRQREKKSMMQKCPLSLIKLHLQALGANNILQNFQM
jgi:hypothetical protein